jgi:hypothetical protein
MPAHTQHTPDAGLREQAQLYHSVYTRHCRRGLLVREAPQASTSSQLRATATEVWCVTSTHTGTAGRSVASLPPLLSPAPLQHNQPSRHQEVLYTEAIAGLHTTVAVKATANSITRAVSRSMPTTAAACVCTGKAWPPHTGVSTCRQQKNLYCSATHRAQRQVEAAL